MSERKPLSPGWWRQTADGVYLNDLYFPGCDELPVWYDWFKVLLPMGREVRDGTEIARLCEDGFIPLEVSEYLPLEPSMSEL